MKILKILKELYNPSKLLYRYIVTFRSLSGVCFKQTFTEINFPKIYKNLDKGKILKGNDLFELLENLIQN